MFMRSEFSGPLPPPQVLEQYAALYPDAPKIIFRAFEKQVNHRHEMEATLMHGSERRARVGQILGTVLLLGGLATAVVVALNEQPVLGGTIATLSLGAGALTYVFGDRPPRQKEEKAGGDED